MLTQIMLLEVVLSGEGLFTLCACKRSLSCVDQSMFGQSVFGGKALLALRTWKRPPVQVEELVSLHVAVLGESLSTLFAIVFSDFGRGLSLRYLG